MKKWVLVLLCLLLAALVIGGGAAWLLLTPRGLLRSDKPEDVMQNLMDSTDREGWRKEFVRLCPAETGEFEDAETVTGDIFDAAVTSSRFTFRPAGDTQSDEEQNYIISGGEADFLLAHLRYTDQQWRVTLEDLHTLSAPRRTLSVTVPEGTVLTLNGKSVGEKYVVERNIPYPDMTELELRFESYPTLVRYEIGGIFEPVTLEAQRDGGLLELYADGTEWRYTLPEGGQYVFSVKAPAEAVVTANGTPLTNSDLTATSVYPTRLDVPEALLSSLPAYRIYTAGGLYTEPAISAALPDGTALIAETAEDGSIAYTLPPSEALREANHGRVEEFLRALCEYGAGHTARYAPNGYVAQGSELSNYITRASGSLYWTQGVATSYDEISTSDYVPLGDDAFLCQGHVVCSTRTRYQTVHFDLHYDMLWIRQGNYWMIQDLAFDEYENTK